MFSKVILFCALLAVALSLPAPAEQNRFQRGNSYNVRGILRSVAVDWFTVAPTRDYFVETAPGQEVKLLIQSGDLQEKFKNPVARQRVMVRGKAVSEDTLEVSVDDIADDGVEEERRAISNLLGSRSSVVIFMTFADGQTIGANDLSDAATAMYGTTLASTNGRYLACSNNQLSFPGDINDVYHVVLNYLVSSYDTSCGNYNNWAIEAYNKLIAQGVSLNYDHFQYVLPPEAISGCSIGRGHLCTNGCSPSSNFPRVWMRYDYRNRRDTYAHELGHNIGMHHSGVQGGNEYADTSDTMGYAATNAKCFNSPHYHYMRWIDNKVLSVNSVSGAGATYNIHSLSRIAQTSAGDVHALILNFPVPVYVEYRLKENGDSGLQTTYANLVGVVTVPSGLSGITRRQANLAVGQSFTGTYTTSGGASARYTITRLADDARGAATVVVSDPDATTTQAPTTQPPTTQPPTTQPPTTQPPTTQPPTTQPPTTQPPTTPAPCLTAGMSCSAHSDCCGRLKCKGRNKVCS